MAKILPEDEVDSGLILEQEADLIASGYETVCPSCKAFIGDLIEVPCSTDVIQCFSCEALFKVGLPEHAYA